MNALEKTSIFFLKPQECAITKGLDNPQKTRCGNSALTRLLFVVQIISTLIALPILFLLSLITLAVDSVKCRSCNPTLNKIRDSFKRHVLFTLPLSFVGIFAPLTTTRKLGDSLNACIL